MLSSTVVGPAASVWEALRLAGLLPDQIWADPDS